MSPPPSGLTLTVSLNLLPGQPASVGSAIDRLAITSVSIKVIINHGVVIRNGFLVIICLSLLVSIKMVELLNDKLDIVVALLLPHA